MSTGYKPALDDAGPNSIVMHELVYAAREMEQKRHVHSVGGEPGF